MTTSALVSAIAAGLFVALAITTAAIYNRLTALRRRCERASMDIDVQTKQRHDLIPNLVETVKGYAGHERSTLDEVIKARQVAVDRPSAGAEAALGGALSRLLAVAEAYPDLKASSAFSELQAEISDTENKIAAARRYFNATVNEYNTSRDLFPANLVANLFDFVPVDGGAVDTSQRVILDATPAVRF